MGTTTETTGFGTWRRLASCPVAETPDIALVSLGVPSLVTGPIGQYFSRVHEREADLFGLEAVPDPDAAMASFRHLQEENLGDLTPSLWKRLNHSHPPTAERLAMIAEWKRRHEAAS